ESKKLHALTKVKRAHQRFQGGAMVPATGDHEPRGRCSQPDKRLDYEVHSLVALESAKIGERRGRGPLLAARCVLGGVDPGVNHSHIGRWNPPRDQILRSTVAYDLKGDVAVNASEWALSQPHGGSHWRWGLLEH